MRRTALVAMLAAVTLAACGGTGTAPVANPTSTTTDTSTPSEPAPSETASEVPTSESERPALPSSEDGAAAYFLYSPAEAEPYLAAVWVPAARDLADALTALLDGPDPATPSHDALSSAVPDGTTLLDVSMEGSTAVIDLTSTFEAGGGSASMFARLAQLTFTATQFADVDDVRLLLDGEDVRTFSNEGIELDQPIEDRDWFDVGVLPKLFVQRPALGETVGSTFVMTGIARDLFEATFTYEVSDSDDQVFAEGPVTAEGSQGWNAFRSEITYEPAEAMPVTLTVAEYSAADGSTVFSSSYPITIDPAR